MHEGIPGYYTITDACKKLGYKGRTYLTTKAREGSIPAYKVGNTILLPAYWVDEEAKKTPPAKGPERGQARQKDE